jgi:hypothetical protein
MKTENILTVEKPHNIIVPFNVPGKPDIGLMDLNKIFQVNLNYNFDSLKTLLEGIVASYKKTEEELDNLKVSNKIKDKKINSLEEKIIDLNILISNSIGDNDAVERLKDMKAKLASGDSNIEYDMKIKKMPVIIKEKEKEKEKESIKKMEKPERTKRDIVPKKRKKIHAPGNKDIQLEIQVGNDDLTNKIIVSKSYLIFKFICYRKK